MTAKTADKHDLYQRSVQEPSAELDFVDRVFEKARGRKPSRLREDFCGTGFTACEWVRRRKSNTALGLDLHKPTLTWGMKHNVAKLTPEQRSRLTLLARDVRTPGREGRGMDCVLAMNFSYFIFKARPALISYFSSVRESLVRDGVFFMDIYGGWESFKQQKERRRGSRFTYVWEQAKYDPISGDKVAHIHFEFKKGPPMKRAFTYEWRMWTIPEVRECLAEAGFGRSTVYWEGDDGKGGGNGIFRAAKKAVNCASFIAYIVAEA